MHTTPRLFVYGSLRKGFQSPAYDYITKYFTLIGDASVPGRLYDNGKYPVAVPADDAHLILGELYVLKNTEEFSWVMEQLDDYEGLKVENGERPLYRRDLAQVSCNGETSQAWIYWFNGPVEGMQPIDVSDMLQYIQHRQ